jgi:hypothetical protein
MVSECLVPTFFLLVLHNLCVSPVSAIFLPNAGSRLSVTITMFFFYVKIMKILQIPKKIILKLEICNIEV